MTAARFTRCTLDVSPDRYEEAVSALLDLETGGWEEHDSLLTFWVPGEAGGRDAAARLSGLGRLSCEPERSDWLEGWRKLHKPVTVAGVTVRAPWHEPHPETLDVVVDVGMAFGTGSHATTRQCLAALAGMERGSLLDVGTGSGVLALAALRLGFAPVYACDIDPDALAAAEANARRNGLAPKLFSADCADPAIDLPQAEIVVANIALRPLEALGRRYSDALARGLPHPRRALLAGLLEDQVEAAVAAWGGYRRLHTERDGEWVLVELAAPGDPAAPGEPAASTAPEAPS